jgi:hypothetical protein
VIEIAVEPVLVLSVTAPLQEPNTTGMEIAAAIAARRRST